MTEISVILPMYNEADHARAVIEGIYTQSVPASVEVIACNDASTDRTGDILEQLGHELDNLRVIHNWENRGIANTLARLTATASGTYLIRVDGDTELQPGALETLYTELKGGADMVFGHIDVWNPETIHQRIGRANRHRETDNKYGGACLGVRRNKLRGSGGWTLRNGGHRNDETTELRRRAAANDWNTVYLKSTLAKTKFPTDWVGIAKRKYNHQWLRNVFEPDGKINWHKFGSPAFWTAFTLALIGTLLHPIAWVGVGALGLVWGTHQYRKAKNVVASSRQLRDFPLVIAYQFASGVLRTIGFYVGIAVWPFSYHTESKTDAD